MDLGGKNLWMQEQRENECVIMPDIQLQLTQPLRYVYHENQFITTAATSYNKSCHTGSGYTAIFNN